MQPFSLNICPACFQQQLVNGVCPACKFVAAAEKPCPNALPHFTLLNNKYRTGKVLGAGGFGITYTAKALSNDALCCIKEYYPVEIITGRRDSYQIDGAASGLSREFLEGKRRFLEEAQILQELRGNVSVVNIWDYFEQNGTAYFVMELLQGCNLRVFQREHSSRQTRATALQMLLFIGSALSEVHRFGLLHGDISPENIIVTQSGEIKLIDFGAARSFTHGAANAVGKIYLKPSYAPFEQYSARPCQGPWTDLYALAATFYAVVSGRRMIEAPRRANGENYVSLYAMNIGISKNLSDVIDHALAFDYHDRYQSMMEFLDDVGQVITKEDYCVEETPTPSAATAVSAPKADKSAKGIEESLSDEELRLVEPQSAPVRKVGFSFFGRGKARRAMTYLELCINGSTMRRWPIPPDRVLKIGRHPDSNIMMPPDRKISREHCTVQYSSKTGKFTVTDLSTYGTFLPNGEQLVRNRKYILNADDKFWVISSYYTFRVVIEN